MVFQFLGVPPFFFVFFFPFFVLFFGWLVGWSWVLILFVCFAVFVFAEELDTESTTLPREKGKTEGSSVFLFLFLTFFCLCPFQLFYSINSLDNFPFSRSVLPVLSLPYWSF